MALHAPWLPRQPAGVRLQAGWGGHKGRFPVALCSEVANHVTRERTAGKSKRGPELPERRERIGTGTCFSTDAGHIEHARDEKNRKNRCLSLFFQPAVASASPEAARDAPGSMSATATPLRNTRTSPVDSLTAMAIEPGAVAVIAAAA